MSLAGVSAAEERRRPFDSREGRATFRSRKAGAEMFVIGLVLAAGVLGAAAVYGIAQKWPNATVAPRLSGEVIEETWSRIGLANGVAKTYRTGHRDWSRPHARGSARHRGNRGNWRACADGATKSRHRAVGSRACSSWRTAATPLSTTVMRDISLLGGTLGVILIASLSASWSTGDFGRNPRSHFLPSWVRASSCYPTP